MRPKAFCKCDLILPVLVGKGADGEEELEPEEQELATGVAAGDA